MGISKEQIADIKTFVLQEGLKLRTHDSYRKILNTKDRDDILTEGDAYINGKIIGYLMENFPEHSIVSEENKDIIKNPDYRWILDPIDGTKYFKNKIPLFTICVALEVKGEMTFGLVYNPTTHSLYITDSNAKSKLYNEMGKYDLSVSQAKPLSEFNVVLELPNHNDENLEIEEAMRIMTHLVKGVRRVRIFGVGALSLCYCAQGAFDIYLNLSPNRKIFDYASGQIILQNANGHYKEGQYIIGGNPENIKTLLDYSKIEI